MMESGHTELNFDISHALRKSLEGAADRAGGVSRSTCATRYGRNWSRMPRHRKHLRSLGPKRSVECGSLQIGYLRIMSCQAIRQSCSVRCVIQKSIGLE